MSDNPAVVDGKIHHLSVSQMQTFTRCKRKWRLDKVEHKPRKPESKGQQRGTEGHERLEQYLTTGLNVLDPLETLALPYLPTPGTVLVEHPLWPAAGPVLFAGKIPIEGYIDLLDVNDPRIAKIYDHKFKSNVETYGTLASELVRLDKEPGIQMVTYAAFVKKEHPHYKLAVLQHNQFQTKGARKFVPVSAEIDLDTALPTWEKWSGEIAEQMQSVAAAKSWIDVPGNLSACHAYGGCDFLDICFDPLQRLAAKFNERATQVAKAAPAAGGNTVGFLNLKATSAPAPAPVPPQAAAQAPATAGPPAATAAQSSATAPVGALTPTPLLGIVPPDSPRNAPPKIEFEVNGVSMDANTAAKTPVTSPPAAAPVAVSSAEAPPAAATVGVTAAPAAPGGDLPKRRVGRPSKAEQAARAAQDPSPATAAPVAPAVAPTAVGSVAAGGGTTSVPPPPPVSAQAPVEASPVPAVPVGGGATSANHRLFIQCIPGGQVVDLLPYTLELQKQIIEGMQVNMPIPDLRLCNDDVLGYGRWKAVLAKAVEIGDLPAGSYLVTTTDERVRVVAEALAALLPAEAVTRGLA